jgi:hypothetical protein
MCDACGANDALNGFSGLVTDKNSGRKMFYINGKPQRGWHPVGSEIYYFNSKGMAENVSVKTVKQLTCTSLGYTLYQCENAGVDDGKTFEVPVAFLAPGHRYDDDRVCEWCGWKEVSFEDCEISIPYKSYKYTGKAIKPAVTVKVNGKKLSSYYDYRVTDYKNNTKPGVGKI